MFKLLIVEDERWEREGLIDFLDWNSYGIEICGAACNGVEGLKMAIERKPDIIITDIKMPLKNGLEMSSEIKKLMPAVNIIILTGYDDFKFAKEAINFNAFTYMLKPIDEDECIREITRVVDKCKKNAEKEKEIESLRLLKLDTPQSIESVLKVDLQDIKSNRDKYLIDKVIQFVKDKYMMNINLKAVANELFISPNHLGYLFKKNCGRNFNEFLLDYQMEKAKEILGSTEYKVAKVAEEVGIPNASYFCVVFKKKYGMSPGEYQELVAREKDKVFE